MGFISTFDGEYAPKLLHRSKTMRKSFETLLDHKQSGHVIVETGCARKIEGDGKVYGPQVPPDHPWYPSGWHGPWSDGMSTVLFDRFAQAHNGNVWSVDLSATNCEVARQATSERTVVTCLDSVKYLAELAEKIDLQNIDLVYLDSFDLDWTDPHASALHHLKELTVLYAGLRKGCCILVDDCYDASGRQGKGKYVEDFFTHLHLSPVIKEYQILWIKD